MKKTISRVVVMALLCAICLSSIAVAEISASKYIDSYSAAMYDNGKGSVSVFFDISGTREMDKIGASVIYLYEHNGTSWSQVKKFTDTNYASEMTGKNTSYKAGLLTYSGTKGYKYYADVYVYANKDGGGDSRYKSTPTMTAS